MPKEYLVAMGEHQMSDSHKFLADLERPTLMGAIARAWCHEENVAKEFDADLADAILAEVTAVLPDLPDTQTAVVAALLQAAAVVKCGCENPFCELDKAHDAILAFIPTGAVTGSST